MFKLLDKIEKSKIFWFLFGVSLLFFLLRLPSLMEPNWYGDEGIYQAIAMTVNQGGHLYTDIWDNKPPLLYLIYAFFQGNQFGVRIFSFFVGLLTLWTFFSLSQKIFQRKRTAFITTTLFATLFAIPLLEANIANAENFMLLPVIASALLIYRFSLLDKSQKKYHIIFNPQHTLLGGAGFLLGIAFLIKSVAIFDFIAFFLFLLFIALPHTWKLNKTGIKTLVHYFFVHFSLFIGGFVTPLIISLIYFSFQGTLISFLQAAFLGNMSYIASSDTFLFPYNFTILKTILLLFAVFFLFKKRTTTDQQTLFILLWLIFSVFNAFFSQRLYNHYVLVILPSFCLLAGLLVHQVSLKKNIILASIFITTSLLLIVTFHLYRIEKTFLYYQNAYLFITGARDVGAYQSFFDSKTKRDYELSSFIQLITKPHEKIFIWGDNPQIYTLSNTLPATKYIVAYHIIQQPYGVEQTQTAINQIKPRIIIILPESPAFPFHLSEYTYKFSFDNARIYERSL